MVNSPTPGRHLVLEGTPISRTSFFEIKLGKWKIPVIPGGIIKVKSRFVLHTLSTCDWSSRIYMCQIVEQRINSEV